MIQSNVPKGSSVKIYILTKLVHVVLHDEIPLLSWGLNELA